MWPTQRSEMVDEWHKYESLVFIYVYVFGIALDAVNVGASCHVFALAALSVLIVGSKESRNCMASSGTNIVQNFVKICQFV